MTKWKERVLEEFPTTYCVFECLPGVSHTPRLYNVYVDGVLVVIQRKCPWMAWEAAYCELVLLKRYNGWTKEEVVEFHRSKL